MLAHVPLDRKRVLDIGCGAGSFGKIVKDRNMCEVWGIEMNTQQAQNASKVLDKVVIGDAVIKISEIPYTFFDCIVCNDILEHLVNPFAFLSELRKYLTPGGVLVASIPNVRYYRVLKDLIIRGDWRYKDSGVLDIDHLRFFTKKSIERMFRNTGWTIKTIEGINPTSSKTYRILNALLLGIIQDIQYRQFALQAEITENVPVCE